jgi:tetratricopeptide (TPR) repeat protein
MDEGLRLGAEDWLVRPEIGYRLAEELKKANRMEEAVALLDKIAVRYPGASTAAHARLLGGTFWEDLGKPELAARAYAELIDQKPTPDDEEAARLRLALLGVQYADTVNLTEPLPGYRDFYRPQPRLEAVFNGRNVERKQMALFGLAEYERKIGVPEKAIDMYISTFKQYPETPVSGRAYERFMDFFEERLAAENASGNYLKTIETYEKYKPFALWTTTRDVGGLSLRAAEAYRALGSPRLARTMYEDALLSGTRAAAHEELAQEILKTRVDQNEPEAYTAWLATHPDDIPIRLKLARSLKTQGNAEEARVEYRKAANSEKNQEAKLAILQEADLLLNQGDNVDERLKAVEDRRKILEKDKKAPPASAERITEARLLFAGGKHTEALKLLEKIENPGPEDRYLTGLCYRALGRNVEAKALFEKLVAEKADPLVADLAAMHLSVMSLQDVEASGRGVFPEPAKLQPKTTSAGAAVSSPKSPEAGKLK